MKKLLIAIPLFALSACATQNWNGQSKMALINHYGLPDQTMKTDAGEIFQYQKCTVVGDTSNDFVVARNHCRKRLFLVKDEVVVKDMGSH